MNLIILRDLTQECRKKYVIGTVKIILAVCMLLGIVVCRNRTLCFGKLCPVEFLAVCECSSDLLHTVISYVDCGDR